MMRVHVAGWVVECRSPSPEVLEEFGRVLGPAPDASSVDAPADVVVEAFVEPVEAMPAREEWTLIEEDGAIALWVAPGGAGLTLGDSQASLSSASAELRFPHVEAAQRSLHTFVTAAINHVARVQGFVPTHSALIGVEGVWMLLLGSSGVGKSTSCLAASTAGHEVASDDTCLLRCNDGRLFGHGLPRAPSLPKADHGLDDGGPVDYRSRTSEPDFPLVQGWHEISGVLVLSHGEEPLTSVGKVPAMPVIEAITEAVAGALSVDVIVDDVPNVLRAATKLPARSLALGRDATRRLVSIDDALRAVSAEFRTGR